ncbi:hypothetical protein Bbelb_081920 [Branchiostoma belcheri]|nr:hypothetical protein Bbelb_081920 [Branchiostoma belcheri]
MSSAFATRRNHWIKRRGYELSYFRIPDENPVVGDFGRSSDGLPPNAQFYKPATEASRYGIVFRTCDISTGSKFVGSRYRSPSRLTRRNPARIHGITNGFGERSSVHSCPQLRSSCQQLPFHGTTTGTFLLSSGTTQGISITETPVCGYNGQTLIGSLSASDAFICLWRQKGAAGSWVIIVDLTLMTRGRKKLKDARIEGFRCEAPAEVTVIPGNQTVRAGDDVYFTCQTDCMAGLNFTWVQPNPATSSVETWTLENLFREDTQGFLSNYNRSCVSVLRLTRVSVLDSGSYTCEVTAPHMPSGTHTAFLTVTSNAGQKDNVITTSARPSSDGLGEVDYVYLLPSHHENDGDVQPVFKQDETKYYENNDGFSDTNDADGYETIPDYYNAQAEVDFVRNRTGSRAAEDNIENHQYETIPDYV